MKYLPVFALIAASWPASAHSGSYVGIWAEKASDCRIPVGHGSGSPMKVTSTSIDGWEYHCDIKKAARIGSGWSIRLSCASEGNESSEVMHFKLTADGGLHESGAHGSRDYVRCPR